MTPLGITLLMVLLGHVSAESQWWQHAVIYQIYPRSFYDSDGDGIGDIQGIIDKLPYIKNLDVDAVWLAPMFKSPQKDFGYDVSDFMDIDPLFGNLTLFASLTKALHDMGIYVVMDFVPNHTSDEHEWFKKALKNDIEYQNYYVWKTKEDLSKVQNNWKSIYGHDAWEYSNKTNKYYYHLFSKNQPDLNYNEPNVIQEMKDILRFWMFMGSDGFTMNSAFALVESDSLEPETQLKACLDSDDYFCFDHKNTADLDATRTVLTKLKKAMDKIPLGVNSLSGTRFMAAETLSVDSDTLQKYYPPVSTFPINYSLMRGPLSLNRGSMAKEWMKTIKQWIKTATVQDEKFPVNWMLGNQENTRIATRFGRDAVDAMNIMNLMLKGTVFTYYGQEIGMTDSFIRSDQVRDPNPMALKYPERLRDPERAPFQWNETVTGFTNKSKPWLPMSPDFWQINVKAQNDTKDNKTHFNVFKQMVKLRKTLVLKEGAMDLLSTATDNKNTDILGIARYLPDNPSVIGLFNLGPRTQTVNLHDLRDSLPPEIHLFTSSIYFDPVDKRIYNTTSIEIPPKAALVFLTQDPTLPIVVDGDKKIKLL